MFFPPSLSPNGKVFVTDQRNIDVNGIARFAPYEQSCVTYWPWLSWNEIDVVVGPDQRAIPRATLIGDSGHVLFSVAHDSIGACMVFQSAANAQVWEVIHNFDWFAPNALIKEFSIAWLRLYVPAGPPVAPVPITGGSSWATAPVPDPNILYVTTLSSAESHFDFRMVSGPFRIGIQKMTAAPPLGTLLYHGLPATQVQFDTLLDSVSVERIPPSPGLGVKFAPTPTSPYDVRFRIDFPL